ncbi:serine hydrolase domain-containing protein [Spirosoma flavum]|uniref:Serine hydrolase domain-containing protein n=1 Tax=Spirosoma flavum TaxID=2048557 RepID=A0ABW6AP37_9BACT
MNNSLFYTLCLVASVLLYGCKHNQDVTPPVAEVISFSQAPTVAIRSSASAMLSATVTAAPTGQAITTGFVWSKTNASPTLADSKTARSATLSTLPYQFGDSLTGLENKATYFARAYLTTAAGTAYSSVVTFKVQIALTDVFAQTLTSLLQNRDIGYGFVIYENNEMKASGMGGLKSRSVDSEGEKPYTLDTKMHIASMSKTIAAMTFTQLAAQKGIRTTDKISPYLPPSWAKGENIDQITFRDLFNHRSGIIGLGNNCQNGAYSENIYSGLKQLIANGVKSANRGQYCYQNANVGLMRVLIPAITGYVFTGNDAVDDQQTQQRYLAYVQTNVLDKVGLGNAIPTYPAGDPTYCYSYTYVAGRKGWNPGNFANTLGAYGWYLTPREAGKLYATVLSSPDQSVLPTAYKDTLLLNNLGCYRASTSLGDLAYHDGWWYYDSKAPYMGLRTIWMKLPNNITVALFVNALNSQTGLFPTDNGVDIVPFVFRAYTTARQLSGGRLAAVTLTLEHPEPH